MDSRELDFALRFVDGRGVLGLPTQTLFGLVGVERLELAVPNLRFPFDLSGGAARFKSRRCELEALELRLAAAELQAWIDGKKDLARVGISGLQARLADHRVELSARARVGENEAPLTARVTFAPAGGQRLSARIGDIRVYGFLPAPAPLLGLALALGLGAKQDGAGADGLTIRGTGELSCNPLELFLWRALPPAGWRLPDYRDAALVLAHVENGAIHLRYGAGEATAPALDLSPDAEAADAALARGDLKAAADAYATLARGPDGAEFAERLLSILTALPARWAEAETLGARLVAERPDRPQPLCALGAIEAERGLYQTAAQRYIKLHELAERAGERDDARLAAARAGELLARVAPKEAIAWLEKTLALCRDDAETATLLAEAYANEGRWQDLLRLERWRLLQASDPTREAEARGRIARIFFSHLNDAVRARDELERALRVHKDDADLWELYAQTLEATGDRRRARAALAEASRLENEGARVELELRASNLAEADGEVDEALARARAALAAAPGHLPALERIASLLERLGRLDEAVTAYQDAIERADAARDDASKSTMLVALARLAETALHDRHGARAYVQRALLASRSQAALRLAVELAAEDGRLVDLEALLGELAAGGDKEAALRRAEVLTDLERHEEAAALAEPLTRAFPVRALSLLARVYEALGRHRDLRATLTRLADGERDPRARLRLAELAAADGDLAAARALVAGWQRGDASIADERRALELHADVLLRQGDDAALEEVLERLSEVREDSAGRARALAAQGAARARQGRLNEALASYRAALALCTPDDDMQVRAGLGEVAYALKLWDEARAALEPLLARGTPTAMPGFLERALRLAEIAERQARPEEAARFYEAALASGALSADAVRAYNALATLHHGRGDFVAEAEVQFRAADDARTNEPDAARATRLVAAADLLRKRAGRRDDAAACYEQALTLDPTQLAALDALESLAAEANDPERVAQVLGRKVAATQKRPSEQKAILGRLAALQAELGRPDAARAAYARALEIDPSFRAALTWLAADAQARAHDEDERAHLKRLVALPADANEPDNAARDWARLSSLAFAAGDLDDAERAARRALELSPREPNALVTLDSVLSTRPPTPELCALLAARAEVETDFDAVVELNFRRAALFEELGDAAAAVAAYEQLLSLRPSAVQVYNRLATLLQKSERWSDLAHLFTRLADRHAAESRAREAEALYVEVAHLHHDRLRDTAAARAALAKALEVAPTSKVALTSLLALARGDDDHGEEDALLGRLVEIADDAAARAQAVTERARARQARGDLEGALALLDDLPLDDAPETALRLRVTIEETRGTLGSPGAQAALEALRARAVKAHDSATERWAVAKLVRLAASRHDTANEALLQRALELDPDDREALQLSLELERGRDHRRAQLAILERMLRLARRGFEGQAREVELGVEMASLLAQDGDLDGALVRLREVLEIAPDSGTALRAYGALLLQQRRFAEAAAALERAHELGALDAGAFVLLGDAYEGQGQSERARAAYDRAGAKAPPKKRAQALVGSAATLGADEAAARYREALALDPGNVDAAIGLGRYAAVDEAERALANAIAASDDAHGRARARLALAAQLRDRVGDGAATGAELERALDESAPFADLARERAELLRTHAAFLRAAGDARAAEAALERLRSDGSADAADLRHLAELYAERGAHDQVIAVLAQLPGSSDTLLRALELEGRIDELVERLAADAAKKPPAEARGLYVRAARLADNRLDDPARAAALLERALPLVADAEVWARLGHLYLERLGQRDRGARCLARAYASDRERVELLLTLGDYHHDAGELAPASDYYREALERRAVTGADKPRVFLRLAEHARARGDLTAEQDALEGALAAGAVDARPRLTELYRARGDGARAAALLIEQAREATGMARAALLRQALPYLAADAASELEDEIVQLDPSDDATRDRVIDRLREKGDVAAILERLRRERRFVDLVATLDEAATAARDPALRQSLATEAAETVERELGHRGEAARRYAALFDEEPTRRDLAGRARAAYAAAGEPIYALAILDREIELARRENVEAAELAQLKIVRGELLLQAGADADAEAEFLHALITTPRVGRAHAALADVYRKRGDVAGALEHLIAAADSADLEPMRAAACAVDAADVLVNEADEVTAERLYQLAAALDPADRRPIDALARLAGAREEYERQVELLGRAAALTADRRERARLALQRARLFQGELGRELDAYRAYKEAVACDPNLADAARALRELAEARGEWALAAEQRYRELALTSDDNERARLHVELGQLVEEKLLDTATALRNYEQAADLLAGRERALVPGPWPHLARLYKEAQRWEEAARAAAFAVGRVPAPDAGVMARGVDDEDPIAHKSRLEAELAAAGDADHRLEVLRELLALAVRTGDMADADVRSLEILARAPDDAEAFVQRKQVLLARTDWKGLAELLRARAASVEDRSERAARRFEAGRIAEAELYDVAAAATDYEAALTADPEHLAALDALADLSYRTRHLSRARALYHKLGDRPSALGGDEVWRRRAELAEEAGDVAEAAAFYRNAAATNPSSLAAHQALARIHLARGEDKSAYEELRAVLDLLPLDAVDRITDLRRHLGELALKLGDSESARHYLELVLSQLPMDTRTLEPLARIYLDGHKWNEAADALTRLSRLVHEPNVRAELLFKLGEIYRLGLADLERANDAYLKAADLHPTHAPTLRRLVAYYYGEGDFAGLKDVTRELEQLGQPLDEVAAEAGLGLALGGDEARGTVVVAVARPSAQRLAELLAAARVPSLRELDPALRASARALGQGGRASLQAALETLAADATAPRADGARLPLARLCDAAGDLGRARVHYSVAAFIDPSGPALARLAELGASEPFAVKVEGGAVTPAELVHPRARGPLREALAALAPLTFGLWRASGRGEPAPAWQAKLAEVVARVSGLAKFDVATVPDLGEPAWAEPSWPPRLLLAQRSADNEAVARFAAARAMHALVAGLPLIDDRGPDDVAALLHAAAALFLPSLTLPERGVAFAAFVRAWRTELGGLALEPSELPEDTRTRVELALAAALADGEALDHAADFARAERLTADRVALCATGDLHAALLALSSRAPAHSSAERAALLARSPLAELLEFALSLTAS